MSERPITRRAHAKLNVALRILGRRVDGYHELESVVLPVSLHDMVTVRPSDQLTVSVTGDGSAEVPVDETNLALVAARGFARALGRDAAVAIEIEKRIPVAGGLGGGSADAAATLLALRELWEVEVGDAIPAEVAAAVGSDVPALLSGSTAAVTGRGDRVRPIPAASTWWAVLPLGFGVRAADAYDWWDEDGVTGPASSELLEAAMASGAPESLAALLSNDLQAPVAARHPEVRAAIDAFVAAGAVGALMSGSGPTVAALAWNEAHADRLVDLVPGSIVVTGPTHPDVGRIPGAGRTPLGAG